MSAQRADGSGLRDEALHPPIRGASCTGRARARHLDGLSFFAPVQRPGPPSNRGQAYTFYFTKLESVGLNPIRTPPIPIIPMRDLIAQSAPPPPAIRPASGIWQRVATSLRGRGAAVRTRVRRSARLSPSRPMLPNIVRVHGRPRPAESNRGPRGAAPTLGPNRGPKRRQAPRRFRRGCAGELASRCWRRPVIRPLRRSRERLSGGGLWRLAGGEVAAVEASD
jgi:hypothetical protein